MTFTPYKLDPDDERLSRRGFNKNADALHSAANIIGVPPIIVHRQSGGTIIEIDRQDRIVPIVPQDHGLTYHHTQDHTAYNPRTLPTNPAGGNCLWPLWDGGDPPTIMAEVLGDYSAGPPIVYGQYRYVYWSVSQWNSLGNQVTFYLRRRRGAGSITLASIPVNSGSSANWRGTSMDLRAGTPGDYLYITTDYAGATTNFWWTTTILLKAYIIVET